MNDLNLEIVEYRSDDCLEMIKLFMDTVHVVNRKDYTETQLKAWTGDRIDVDLWHDRFSTSNTVLIKTDGAIVGFGNIVDHNYIDMFYVHKDYQGLGVGSLLLKTLEARSDQTVINVDASITAKGFFEHYGYSVITEQIVSKNLVGFKNYHMRKTLIL